MKYHFLPKKSSALHFACRRFFLFIVRLSQTYESLDPYLLPTERSLFEVLRERGMCALCRLPSHHFTKKYLSGHYTAREAELTSINIRFGDPSSESKQRDVRRRCFYGRYQFKIYTESRCIKNVPQR